MAVFLVLSAVLKPGE